ARMAEQSAHDTPQPGVDNKAPLPGAPPSGWRAYLDVKHIVTGIVLLILGGIFTLVGQTLIGGWSMVSENQETRLLEKIRKDEPLAAAIIEKIRKDDALANNIINKFRDSGEFKAIKDDVADTKKQITEMNRSIGRIEGNLRIAKA